ncbi:flagellin, partial [Escherichia coli]|uniref:flagellin N-terminal helical domain-containing protein n=1 Tax=Escherichia coli TaxID=562 RepID=UPI0016BA36E3
MADVTLTAALRSNLLSLQGTQRLLDQTQLRLATGRKVNSAIDDAGSFFAAQSVNFRASDLENRLDGIGQGIQVLKAA